MKLTIPPGVGKSVYPKKQPPFNEWLLQVRRELEMERRPDLAKAFDKLKRLVVTWC
jgi:hypothetical protein